MTATGTQITPLDPGTPEWLKLLTASKVAATVGLSPYDSAFSLWHSMANLTPRQPDNDLFRRGHYLEPAIVAWWQDQHPDWTITPGGMWQHTDPRFAASPDRIVTLTDGETRCLEVKTAANGDEWGTPGSDEIPPGYRAQGIWQMICTGTQVVHYAMLGSYLTFAEYVLEWDQAEADWLLERGAAFMDSLPGGTAEKRPDLDSHDATYEAVRQLHPSIDGDTVELDSDTVVAYCEARHSLAAAKTEETRTKSLLADALGNGKKATYLGTTIATRASKSGGTPYITAAKNLPHFTETSAAA